MKRLDITVPLTEASFEELSPAEQNLVTEARRQTITSYAPYSHFHVGAAILLDNGEVVTGSNQENAAYVPSAQRHSMPTHAIPKPVSRP